MATSTDAGIITPEQFAAMPNSSDYELVDGRLVERLENALSFIEQMVSLRHCTAMTNCLAKT